MKLIKKVCNLFHGAASKFDESVETIEPCKESLPVLLTKEI
jgi:hypothetical protein